MQHLKAELARAKSKMVEAVVVQSLKSEYRGDHGRSVKKDKLGGPTATYLIAEELVLES